MKSDYIALIPAYEPEELMIALLRDLQSAEFHIVVVDDGSGDEYAELFKTAADYAHVLTHTVNQGKGAALKTGLTYIKEHYGDSFVVVTVDADGQHSVEDALSLCELAEKYPDELILGGRALKDNVPLRSQIGNTITRAVYRLSTGLKVHDTQSGLRAFASPLIPQLLEIQGKRYEYEMNVLLEFARKRIPIREVEIQTIYIQNNAASHFDTIKDSYRIYKEIIKFSAASFIGFLVDYCVFCIVFKISSHLVMSNVVARVVSATVNYTLNRKFVFKSKNSVTKSAAQYFLLALLILAGNTAVLGVLVRFCKINEMAAKILTELAFFVLSWSVQKFFIFKRSKESK